jgi:hypothetical protein
MPLVNGEYIFPLSANQLDELIFNINFGSVTYRALQPITIKLFSSQTVAASTTVKNTVGVYTGNNAKMSYTFSLAGSSTNCTMNLYGSDHEDLSLPRWLATMTLGSVTSNGQAIDPIAIPAYTFAEIVNGSTNPALVTVEITTWKEPA